MINMVKRVFEEIIDMEVKVVTELIVEKGTLAHFSIALLKLSKAKWVPVRRWDNSHRYPHVHIYKGETERICKISSFSSVARLVNEIRRKTKKNYQKYIETFQNEK